MTPEEIIRHVWGLHKDDIVRHVDGIHSGKWPWMGPSVRQIQFQPLVPYKEMKDGDAIEAITVTFTRHENGEDDDGVMRYTIVGKWDKGTAVVEDNI